MDFDEVIEKNASYFVHKCDAISSNLINLRSNYKVLTQLLNDFNKFVHMYDFDKEVQANGYRSFVEICQTHMSKAEELCQKLNTKRDSFWFNEQKFINDLIRYNTLFLEFIEISKYFIEGHDKSGSLFTEIGVYDNKLTKLFNSMNIEEGYVATRHIKADSIKSFIDMNLSSLAAHSKAFFAKQPMIIKSVLFLLYYIYYSMFKTARYNRSVKLFKYAGMIYFQNVMKIFEDWFLFFFSSIIETKIRYKKVLKVDVVPLELVSETDGKTINVTLPQSKTVECFLYMNKDRMKQPSKYLIFHIHGGGFFSQTPRSHGSYLKMYSKELDAPVLSVNYSLSPQAVFPEALDQCFYIYCMALKQPQQFGWTGENIVFTGDSAGGNLVTACTIKCIETGVTRPTGVFPVYGVFLSQYAACPSRFQSFYDTIISYNVYNAIFSAYHGVRGSKMLGKNDIFEDKSVEKLTNEKAKNYLCSPYYAPDEILKKFPPTTILSTNIDPCLDECVEFAKRLRSNNMNMKFTVLKGVPHAFLSLCIYDKDCKEATDVCIEHIRELLQIKETKSV